MSMRCYRKISKNSCSFRMHQNLMFSLPLACEMLDNMRCFPSEPILHFCCVIQIWSLSLLCTEVSSYIFFLHTVVHALLSYKLHPREYLHLLNSRIGIWTIIFLSIFIIFFAPYKDFVNIFLISGITFTPHTFLCTKERKRH